MMIVLSPISRMRCWSCVPSTKRSSLLLPVSFPPRYVLPWLRCCSDQTSCEVPAPQEREFLLSLPSIAEELSAGSDAVVSGVEAAVAGLSLSSEAASESSSVPPAVSAAPPLPPPP
jgi:hypothetical protein